MLDCAWHFPNPDTLNLPLLENTPPLFSWDGEET